MWAIGLHSLPVAWDILLMMTAGLEPITPCPITEMIHIRMVVLPSELCRLMYLHIWYANLVLFTWFFYKCKPFKVINPVIICRGDWIRHLVALEEGGGGTEYWLSSANELTAESQSWGEWAAQGTVPQGSSKNLDNSAAKQQISWVVSLWRLPLTFVWPGVPKDGWLGLIGAPSDGDRNAIWRYFVSMRLYIAMLLYVSIPMSNQDLCTNTGPPNCISYHLTRGSK